jgi:GntR family transcriptional regulator
MAIPARAQTTAAQGRVRARSLSRQDSTQDSAHVANSAGGSLSGAVKVPDHDVAPDGPASADARAGTSRQRRVPLHRRVYAGLKADIASGRLGVGDLLPSEADISSAYNASRITVRHALDRLAQSGLVRKRHGVRAQVIAGNDHHGSVWRLESLDDIISSAGDAQIDIGSFAPRNDPQVAALFGAEPRAKLPCLRSRLLRGGQCYARSTIYFRPDIGQRLSLGQFDDVIVFRVLQRDLGITITDVRVTVRAMLAEPEDGVALGADKGEAVIETMFVYRAGDGPPVEVAFSRQRAADFSLTYALKAGPY